MIDFGLTPEQEMLRASLREFIRRECPKDYIRELDEEGLFPLELMKKMVKLGWANLALPVEYGGADGTLMDIVIATEELARGGMVLAFSCGANWGFPAQAIIHFSNKKQKDFYFPLMAKGEMLFAFALTEPNAGSDALAIKTIAVAEGDYFILNGNKIFTSMAHIAHRIIVVAKTDKDAPPHKAITMFIVDPKSSGVEIRKLKTLGRHAEGVCEVFFENVRVPKQEILGELNRGWSCVLQIINRERVSAGALYLGGAQAVIDEAVQYAKEREQFGRPIGKFQAIQHMLADMGTRVQAARLLIYNSAWKFDQGLPVAMESAMAKLSAAEAYVDLSTKGMQIMGGYGYMMEYPMQRHFRDSRPATIAGGTSEILRNRIAAELGL